MPHPVTPSRLAARFGMGMVATIWLGLWATGAGAQDAGTPPPAAGAAAAPSTDAADETIAFAADSVAYDNNSTVVTASGTVQLERQAWRLRADRVVWNRTTGRVTAEGNVALTNPQGDVAYGETVELSDTLKDGVVENLLLVLSEGGRLAARHGERLTNGDMILDHAAYTPCPVETADGCPTKPSWQVRAVRVYYDQAHQRMRYQGARIELFGLPMIPMPGLSHPVGDGSGSGLLVPEIRVDRVNGVEIALPYYLSLSPSRDITVTPHVYSNAMPMGELEVRGLTARGAWQVHGYATYSRLVPLNAPATDEREDFRGYIEGSGGFQFDPRWSLSFSGRIATDRTFLRRYDISRDDRLRSTFTLARNGGSSYLTISGWAVQTLRANDSQGQQPIALPLIDFRQRIDDPWLGGLFVVQANTLALTRTSGQDTQRAFVSAQWDWRSLTSWGQEIRLTALGRGDLYHTDDSLLTAVPGYRGKDGWQSRAFASAAVDVSWPLIGALWGGTQQLTPRVQVVATSPVENVDIPNEDSRAFELDDGNIFALNRFPGYDRYEDNTRVTYGVEWTYDRPGLRISSMLAQSYRLDDKPSLFPNGTGLTGRVSDIVGRTTIAYGSFVRLTHQFRLDKDTMAVRRNEIDATIGSRSTYALIGYSRLNRDISAVGEDLSDREEVRLGGRVQFARYWSLFGSAIVDLTDRTDDPLNTSDGFTPIRHRLGITYEDDCLTIGLTWKRDYRDTGDARSGNTFLLRLAFRNLGV